MLMLMLGSIGTGRWTVTSTTVGEPSTASRIFMPSPAGAPPRLPQPDRRRREAGDAREQLLEVALLHAGNRVAVVGEGAVERAPVVLREVALGERQQLALLLAHVRPVELGVLGDRRQELARAGGPALLEEQQRALELADQARAF